MPLIVSLVRHLPALAFAAFAAFFSSDAFAATALQKQSGAQCLQAPTNELRVAACTTFILTNPPTTALVGALNQRGFTYRRLRKFDLALADVTQALSLAKSPQDRIDAFSERGSIRFEQGNFAGAIDDYNLALAVGPRDRARYMGSRAKAYERSGQFELARKDHDDIIGLRLAGGDKARLADAYNGRAVTFILMDEMELARADIAKEIELDPKAVNGYVNRALIHRIKGEYGAAIDDYDIAIRLAPKSVTAMTGRGETRRLQGDLEAAIADFNRAIEFDPGAALALVHRADTRRYAGESDRAIEDYKAALAIRPDFPLAFVGRGLAYEKRGDLAEARRDFETVAGLSPYQYDTSAEALRTARARLAALDSGAPEPILPPAPKKAMNPSSIPTPDVTTVKLPPPAPVAKPRVRQGRRIALVIGNSAYRSVGALANPKKDAEGVAGALRRVGFDDVVLAVDLPRENLLQTLHDFASRSDQSDWAMVYYAGHGMEVSGQNYLIPVDAKLAADRDIQFEAVPVDQVMVALEGAKKLRLIVLDACRDNPFAPQMRKTAVPVVEAAGRPASGDGRTTRAIGRGLGEVRVSGASLVVFAAKHGQVALDGEGGNSPFAVSMIQRIATPGVELSKLFRLVRDDVMGLTAGRQEPYTYGSLPGEDFFFVASN